MEETWPIKSIRVASDLIETILRDEGVTLTELATEFDLPKSTMHGYLKSLRLAGLLIKDDGTYRVSTRFLEIGSYVRTNRPIYEAGKKQVRELSCETGQRASLMIEENCQGVTLYTHSESPRLDIDVYPGFRTELHATSGGKAILAALPREKVSAIVNRRGLKTYTEHTITDYETLLTELKQTAEQGYATNVEEHVSGMHSYGCAVTDDTGYPIGAVVVFGPTSFISRGEGGDDPEVVRRLRQTVNIIEVNMTI